MGSFLRRTLRHAGPAMGFTGWTESLRASAGMFVGMVALILFLSPDPGASAWGLFVIAPFGASAVLLFALPNSPLAQPWSAVVGNAVSALVGVALVLLIDLAELRIVLAPALAVLAMHLSRALHPPGGAVALATVLAPHAAAELGFLYVLVPVALGTLALVPVAALAAAMTGRRYPFRQPAAPGQPEPRPLERLGVSRAELAGLLQEFHQSANIGVEDLARLISAAELLAARHQTDGVTCGEIMSRDLVTVRPDAPLTEVAAIFRDRGFTSLPVVAADGRYLGVIFQIHLIRRGAEDASLSGTRFSASLARLFGAGGGHTVRAQEVMDPHVPTRHPDTPVHDLLPLLAEGPNDAVPILDTGTVPGGPHIAGIVTRTDLIAALAHQRKDEG